MITMYNVGETVIDTKKDSTGTVCGAIEYSCPIMYVLEDNEGNYYLQSEENLLEYTRDNMNKLGW